MNIDYELSTRARNYRDRIRQFIDEVVIPREADAFENGVTDDLRRELQCRARELGVWAPQAPAALGGGGFSFSEVAALLEEAGTSLLGPLALNCAAPDEGNMRLLDRIGSDLQRSTHLAGLVSGRLRSCFAMTEPAPGAGSDPSALQTTAERVSGGWRLNGAKHLITGADGADFAVVIAAGGRSDGSGATMFLVDSSQDGWQVDSHIRTIDATTVGGHCRVSISDLTVADSQVLGEPGEGFRYAQLRLVPARLTHCMRFLGAARRTHEIALGRAVSRQLFGSRLADLGMAQRLIADNEIDLHAARALLWQTCRQLDQGSRSAVESSRTKVFVSEAVGRIVDRSVQLCGGLGTSVELVVGQVYADVRAFRIYDGSSETLRMSIARHAARAATKHPER